MKKPTFELICPKCGKKAEPDRQKSTKQWDVLPTVCADCNVRYEMKFSK